MNGKSQLRTISRAFPVSISVLEVLFLVSLGVIAVVLRAKLRIPMQMPGRHGLEVMALLMIGRKASNLPIATSISTFAAAFMVMFPLLLYQFEHVLRCDTFPLPIYFAQYLS